MAKRKKSRRRRRRMGAVRLSQDRIMKAAGVITGVIATGMINEQINKMTSPPDPAIVALSAVLLGFFLPSFVKNDFVEGVGFGMIGAGGVNAAKEFGIISGIPVVGGYQSLKAINGLPEPVKRFIPAAAQAAAPSTSQVITGITSTYFD